MSRCDERTAGGLRPSRRMFLGSVGTLTAWAGTPRIGFAADRDPRLLVIILRGALDGLAVVAPIGDPDYASLRGKLAIGSEGREQTLPLDGFFGLNDSLALLHARYHRGEVLLVHAVATPYRERSHFDGQDVLESGMPTPRSADTGWLNRAVAALPAGERISPPHGMAVSPSIPLILRGIAPTITWTPANIRPAGTRTVDRLLSLYTHSDPELAAHLRSGIDVDAVTGGMGNGVRAIGSEGSFRQMAAGAGRMLARADGPKVAVLSYDGWDTHADEGPENGRLSKLLGVLDRSLEQLAAELATVWRETVVAVITEFGRTALVNGTGGTDHGIATTAVLVGGAVKGGRVVADWPGLGANQLFKGRDLAATTDLRAVLKGVLRDHFGLSESILAQAVFPDSVGVRPLDGVIR